MGQAEARPISYLKQTPVKTGARSDSGCNH